MHCPSFCILLAHFADDLYGGLVCHLCLTIFLRVIGRWTMVLNLIEFQHLPYFIVNKGCAIIIDNPVRYPKPHNYVFFDGVCYYSSCGFTEWHCLCPFGEVFHSHQIHMYSRDGGLTGPTKSSLQVWKSHTVTMLCKFYRWVWIRLACTWQLWHLFTNSAMSFFMAGQ